MNFKVGDKVRRIIGGGDWCGMAEGDVDKVIEVFKYSVELSRSSGHDEDCLELVREAKPTYPNPPHKHAELIKAWADGAEIEVEAHAGQCFWISCAVYNNPQWNEKVNYRIKPQRSNKDIQIDKLEQQAKDLANEIRKLKE